MSENKLMSMREYGKHRGVSGQAVSKAVAQGRITTVVDESGLRKINPEQADKEWEANYDASKERREGKGEDAEPKSKSRPTYADSRAMREYYNARKADLEFRERSGKLVDIEEVKTKWLHIANVTRTKIMGIPSKIRQRVPELAITQEAYAKIEAIVYEALEDVANGES